MPRRDRPDMQVNTISEHKLKIFAFFRSEVRITILSSRRSYAWFRERKLVDRVFESVH